MEKQLIYLFFLLASLSACKQTEITPPTNVLNGVYRGEVTYIALTATGEIDSSYHTNTHSIEFEIANNTFNRPECGCNGAVSVDTLSNIATFTSSEKACVDGGANAGSSWSFQNDIIGRFTFIVTGNTLKLVAPGSNNPFESKLQKTILVVRQIEI